MSQKIFYGNGSIKELENILTNIKTKKFMLVCDSSYPFLSIKEKISLHNIPHISFNEFTPNPLYEDVVKGVELFNIENCDAIVAIGGGSSIDVAKSIKLYCKMDSEKNYLQQEYKDTNIPLIAIPTTAGTGSESTRYAVIYYEGKKQSITHNSIIPNYAILEPSILRTLPIYQKKCTMLDALCQGIESWWSVNSTGESRKYSKIAVETIMANYKAYIFENNEGAAEKIMLASNYAGRAINITQTTAAHAMSYKITSMYGIPHGHAVAICLYPLWRYMSYHLDDCIDSRGEEYIDTIFNSIAMSMGCNNLHQAIEKFSNILKELDVDVPNIREKDIDILTASVNNNRLENNPISLSKDVLNLMYLQLKNAGKS